MPYAIFGLFEGRPKGVADGFFHRFLGGEKLVNIVKFFLSRVTI